jgi:hypothetical protein
VSGVSVGVSDAFGAARVSGGAGESVFALANAVDTRLLLDRYGIEHDGKHARCPGCGESGALLCERGGLKCLHNRCAHVGPANHPGLRLNVDLVAEREGVAPDRAAELVCEWFGVPRPATLPRAKLEVVEWTVPIPLGEHASPTRFPTQALPGALRAWVECEAIATQTPCDLAAVVALATISACVAKKVEVQVRQGWCEPLNTYWLVALEPGNRKSAVFRDAVAPLHRYEKAARERLGAPARAAITRRLVKERQLRKAIDLAARTGLPTDCQHAEELAVELDSDRVQVAPQLVVDDVTPERLAAMLAEQGGRLAVLSAEGGLFELAGGRYSDGIPNLDVYLKAHPGDDLRVDRLGRGPVHVRKPALTLGLAVQPEVIRDLARKRGFRGTGLLARFFYSLPQSLVGRRQISPPAVPREVTAGYEALCSSLLTLPEHCEADGELAPLMIRFDADGRGALERFAAELETRLGSGGDLAAISDWSNKLVGGTARIAGLLHFAAHAPPAGDATDAAEVNSGDSGNSGSAGRGASQRRGIQQAPWASAPDEQDEQGDLLGTIDEATVRCAIAIAEYLIEHAQAAFDLMGADVEIEHARRLLGWIRRTRVTRFSKRDAWQATRGYVKKASELDAPLQLLCEHGYLREEDQQRRGPGRKASALFAVNPHPHNSHNPQNRLPAPGADARAESAESVEDAPANTSRRTL